VLSKIDTLFYKTTHISDEEEQAVKPLYFFDLIKKDSEEASVWSCKYSEYLCL
jgi:hypothetical protein